MKVLFFAASFFLVFSTTLQAQDMESVQTQVFLRQFKNAKTSIDKVLSTEKATKKPEPWAMKTIVYTSLAQDSTTSKEEAIALFDEALIAFNKYKELDPKYALLKESFYTSAPINLYTNFFKKGVEGFNIKDWNSAYKNFAAAVDYSDFLIDNKITNIKMDTISILYAGASAQNLKNDAQAFKYFARLADAKIVDKDYEFFYQFLVSYAATKKDDAAFGKYVSLGKTLYPDSKYFPAMEEEYANSKDEFYVQMKEGEELFSKLYPKEDKDAPTGDVAAMEAQLVNAFTKAAAAKPEKAGIAHTNIGNHYINKSIAVNKKINALSDDIKAMNKNAKPDKNGKLPPVPKDLLAKKEALFQEYDGYADEAIRQYEKAAASFNAKKSALDNIEKQYYKNSVSYLIDLYAEKKSNTVKSNPTQSAKYASEEKKWNDVYNGLK